MWESVLPTEEWAVSYLPSIVAENAFQRPNNEQFDGIDYETHRYVYRKLQNIKNL